MEDKKQKRIRVIGLITLTVLVIVGVILAIYFTQKKDNENNQKIEYIVTDVNKVVNQDAFDFIATIDKDAEIEGDIAHISLSVTITAKQDMNLALSDFIVNNSTLESQNGFKNDIKSGESLSFELNFVVKTNQSLYLIYKNIKVNLGEVF